MNALAISGALMSGASTPVPGSGARLRQAATAAEVGVAAGKHDVVLSGVERALLPVLAPAYATGLFPITSGDATGLPPRAAPV